MRSQRNDIAVFGGTFNPIHNGHLAIAQAVLDKLNLGKVVFVPCNVSPFKPDALGANAQQRLEMCTLACQGNPAFEVSDIEIARGGISYSVDTVEQIRAELAQPMRICWIIGSDAFADIPSWRDSDRLVELVSFAIAMRPGDSLSSIERMAEEMGASFQIIDDLDFKVSSTRIRQLIESGLSARYMVPDSVESYILANGLYTKGNAGSIADPIDPTGHVPSIVEGRNATFGQADLDPLGDEFFDVVSEELKGRVKKKRHKHSVGVSQTSAELARLYGQDIAKARLAGILHDWDKGYDDEGIRLRVHELGLESQLDPILVEELPQILHGPTAAAAIARDYPQVPEDVLSAIRKHTTADVEMADLDKIVYIADAIEPSRNFDIVDELRQMMGKVSLDDLYYEVYRFWTASLIEAGRALHPESINIWNSIVSNRRSHADGSKGKGPHNGRKKEPRER